jgi:hypothetical protein
MLLLANGSFSEPNKHEYGVKITNSKAYYIFSLRLMEMKVVMRILVPCIDYNVHSAIEIRIFFI